MLAIVIVIVLVAVNYGNKNSPSSTGDTIRSRCYHGGALRAGWEILSLLGQITKILLLLCYAAINWHQTSELNDRNGATEQCLWRNQHSSKFPLAGPGPGCEHNSVLDKELITISRSVDQINWWLGCCCHCFSNWGLVAVFVFLGQSCRSFSLLYFSCNFPFLLVPLLFHP